MSIFVTLQTLTSRNFNNPFSNPSREGLFLFQPFEGRVVSQLKIRENGGPLSKAGPRVTVFGIRVSTRKAFEQEGGQAMTTSR